MPLNTHAEHHRIPHFVILLLLMPHMRSDALRRREAVVSGARQPDDVRQPGRQSAERQLQPSMSLCLRPQVMYDAVSRLFVALVNPMTADSLGADQRNILELAVSADLRAWRPVATVLWDDTGLRWGGLCLRKPFLA